MSIGNTTETDILALLFNATTIANVAINATASPLTQVACALHTSDPGEAGDLSTNEAGYTAYARQNINRDSGGFTVAAGSCSPVADTVFPTCTASSSTVTHMSFGKTGGGSATLWYSGTATPNVAVVAGVAPIVKSTTAITLD
jgi:hypothetical protein